MRNTDTRFMVSGGMFLPKRRTDTGKKETIFGMIKSMEITLRYLDSTEIVLSVWLTE